jgi:hypothetical protein
VDNAGATRTDCTIPGGAGVTGSGTTGKIPKWTGAGAVGDSVIDDGLTTANTVTINNTGGLNITGSALAGFLGLKAGTANSTVTNEVGFSAPAAVTAFNFVTPGAAGNGFLSNSNTANIVTQIFRSMAATSPITITNQNGIAGDPTYACPTCGVTGTGLGQFASTTSAQLATVLSDEIGSGKNVFASAYQGDGANVMSSSTVANNQTLCSSTTGAGTTSNCNVILYGTSGASVSLLGVGIPHLAGSTNVITSSAINLAGGANEVTGVLPLTNIAQQFVVNAQTTTYQVLAADFSACKTITVASGTFTITLVASGSQPASGQCIDVVNYGSGTVTIARSGQNINGAAANLTLGAASSSSPIAVHVVSDGTNYFAETMGSGAAGGVTSVSGDGTVITNSASSGAVTLTIAGTSGGVAYFNTASTWASSPALTNNSPVLGGGAGAAPKVVAGITSDGTSQLRLGVAGTSVGSVQLANATSGTITLQPPTGALGAVTITVPATTGTAMLTNTNVSASQMPALTGDATTNAGAVATTLGANFKRRAISFTIGDPGNSSALTVAATTTSYVTVPFACTISAYNLMIDAGTITVKFWKVATGTAIPTSGNSINTSGVGISSGTAIHSTTISDFTTTTVSQNDMMAMNVTAVATAKFVNGVLQCDQ